MKRIIEKNILRKYLLMIACLILFIAGGYRAFTLYKTFHSYQREVESIETASDKNIHSILEIIIKEAHDSIEYTTKMDATTLHRLMVESMSQNEIYDNIVNMNLNDKLIKILDDVFDLSNDAKHTIITVGTKEYVFYSKSNIDLDKYKYLETDGEKYITWDEYFKQMKNPKIVEKAYEDLVLERSDYVIIKISGDYPNGTYCTIDDVIKDYHDNGAKNMDDYYILTLGVITDNGDIFGESDLDYLNKNPNVNKIYIFKAVSISSYLDNYKGLIKSLDQSASTRIIEYRNNTEFGNALINIFLITSSIITLMVVIKSLDDENDNLIKSIKDDEPK